MGPSKTTVRTISQEAFEEVVKENIDDLGMDPADALQDAIQTLTLQGVDLSGIITCVPGETNANPNPVIECLDNLRRFDSQPDPFDLKQMVLLLTKLHDLCTNVKDAKSNAAIAAKNGGVRLICSICSKIPRGSQLLLLSTFHALASLLNDVQSTGTFHACDGPSIVIGFLNDNKENVVVADAGFRVVASAATRDEIVKESFMELKIDELIVEILSVNDKFRGIPCLYDAIRVLSTPDDNRVVASQVYGYARRFAKVGIAESLLESLSIGLMTTDQISACNTLKAIAVNDEICKSIAEKGGIDVALRCISDTHSRGWNAEAKAGCSLLSKLAGSDMNKSEIVRKGGMEKLVELSARFDDPSLLQEVMSVISVLSLRSPENASRAIEAGAGDLAIQAMQKFPAAHQMQRNSCLMIRNLVVRNPENRTILLNNGIEKYIRKAKETHINCKDAATDALRDLGLDNYNL